jgi:hypothetical protein
VGKRSHQQRSAEHVSDRAPWIGIALNWQAEPYRQKRKASVVTRIRGLRIRSTGIGLLLPDQFPTPAFVHPVLLAIPRIEKREDQARFGRAFGAEYLSFLAPFVASGPVFIDATH